MPLVSIIVPVYKTEQYIKECVDSILNQTLKDIEIILVDDGSPDNCPNICDDYAKQDNRIVVIHKLNGGLSSARNEALKVAKGDYIGFVDSDDFIEATMYEELYNSAVKNKSDISICAHSLINNGKKDILLPYKKGIYVEHEITDNFLIPLLGEDPSSDIYYLEGFVWRQLFKKELIINRTFKSEREYFAEDVVFDLEIYQECSTISVVNKPLYCYRYNEASLSNKYRKNIWNMLTNLLDFKSIVIDDLSIKDKSKNRVINETVRFVKFSVLNLGKTGCDLTKEEKIGELKRIVSSKYSKTVFSYSTIMNQDIKTRVLFLLLKFKLFRLVLILI